MMVTGTDPVVAAGTGGVAEKNDVMGKDEFLTLLVAQLQAQDPLNPMESTEFTAQLAQFSSLEQLQNINTGLDNMAVSQESLNSLQMIDFIGKDVTATGSSVALSDGAADELHFTLDADAASGQIAIFNASGSLVKSIDIGAMEAGNHTIAWDGTDNLGVPAVDGSYRFTVAAEDAVGSPVSAGTFVTGQVTGVTFKNGQACVLVGSKEIPVSSIVEVAAAAG